LIFLTIIVVLLFSFSFSILFLYFSQDTIEINKKFFYEQMLKEEKPKIFLIGSSHVMPIHPEKIEEFISVNGEYVIFNIAEAADSPKNRIRQLDHIILSKPNLIVYGLGYHDFAQKPIIYSFLPNPKNMIEDIFSFNLPYFLDDPKFQTLSVIRNFLLIEESGNFEEKTPFFEIKEYLFYIRSNEQLDQIKEKDLFIPIKEKNDNYDDFKTMISSFNENGIKIIIILTPLRDVWVDEISEQNKHNFDLIIDEIKQFSNVSIYSLMSNYTDQNFWRDNEHITNDKSGLNYTNDVAKIILKEI